MQARLDLVARQLPGDPAGGRAHDRRREQRRRRKPDEEADAPAPLRPGAAQVIAGPLDDDVPVGVVRDEDHGLDAHGLRAYRSDQGVEVRRRCVHARVPGDEHVRECFSHRRSPVPARVALPGPAGDRWRASLLSGHGSPTVRPVRPQCARRRGRPHPSVRMTAPADPDRRSRATGPPGTARDRPYHPPKVVARRAQPSPHKGDAGGRGRSLNWSDAGIRRPARGERR